MATHSSINDLVSREANAEAEEEFRGIDEYEASAPAEAQEDGTRRHGPKTSPSPAVEDSHIPMNSELDITGRDHSFAGIDKYRMPAPADDEEAARIASNERSFLEDDRQRTNASRQSRESAISRLSTTEKAAIKHKERIVFFTTTCWILFFSIWGALARIGLSALTVYTGSPLGGVIWANFAGCVVMGFMSEEIHLFSTKQVRTQHGEDKDEENDPHWGTNKKIIPLYVGITTGFCGSLTSFSTWMRDVFFGLSDTQPHYLRHRGYNVEAILAEIIATLCLSLGGLSFGAHIAILLRSVLKSIPIKWRPFIDRIGWVLGPGCWLGVTLMSIFIPKWRKPALFAGVFAPIGAWLRFMASRKLNSLVATFPMGTFTVNLVGTIILATGLLAQADGISKTGCQVWQGIDDGFCGSLTTVSTFVVELKSMRRKHSYLYGGVTVISGVCLMTVILGSFTWARGLEIKRC